MGDIVLKPAVKKYYVELQHATLHDPLGDFERLQAALVEKYDLCNLTIDYRTLLTLQEPVRKNHWKVTVSVWKQREIIDVEAGEVEKAYGLAR